MFKAVNSGATVHALEIESEGIEGIEPGRNAKLEVHLKAGTYELSCPVDVHNEKGMEGTVTVEEDSGTREATDAERSIKGPVKPEVPAPL